MGLIQQAHLVEKKADFITAKKKIGLLNKVIKLSSYDIVLESFKDYLYSIKAERAGILCPSDDGISVFLLNSGFDLTTSRRFCPQASFLNKLVSPKNEFQKFTGSSLDDFSFFFSSRELDSLQTLYIRPLTFTDSYTLYLVLADSSLNIARINISIIEAEKALGGFMATIGAHLPTITALSSLGAVNQSYSSMKTHVESALNSKRIATLAQISFAELFPDLLKLQTDADSQTVFYAMAHRIARQAGSANITFINKKCDIRMVLFTTVPVDTELYFSQLMKPLEKIFGTQRTARIHTAKIGTSTSVPVTMDFLTGEV